MNAQDIRNLSEAYMEVYAPQELTEEQVWGEVENLVNYLIEEGYDLSDYTWEEMYESYILEVHSVDAERLLMHKYKNTGEPYRQRQYLKSKPKKKTVGN